MDIITRSVLETEALAARLAETLPRGSAVALRGDLGAGKTAFARGFARGLGITEPVSSPTFTIAQEYAIPGGGRMYHLDLYRIGDSTQALAFGVEEFLSDEDSFCLIEWPERVADILPPGTLAVDISHLDGDSRAISAPGLDPQGAWPPAAGKPRLA